MRQEPDRLLWIILACLGGLITLMLRPWNHWDAITSAPERFWAGVLHHWSAFWQGMTTHGLAAGIVAFLFLGAVGLLMGWLNGRRLAKTEVSRAQAQAAAAKRQAADERQMRIDAEKRADAAEALARRSVADKAEAERLYEGLIGQFHQAVSMADRRGKQLREGREKKRAERGELPVQQIQKAAPLTNGQNKKPRTTQKRKRPGKGRSPSRLPSRLPRR